MNFLACRGSNERNRQSFSSVNISGIRTRVKSTEERTKRSGDAVRFSHDPRDAHGRRHFVRCSRTVFRLRPHRSVCVFNSLPKIRGMFSLDPLENALPIAFLPRRVPCRANETIERVGIFASDGMCIDTGAHSSSQRCSEQSFSPHPVFYLNATVHRDPPHSNR